jgi:hypothetical protein
MTIINAHSAGWLIIYNLLIHPVYTYQWKKKPRLIKTEGKVFVTALLIYYKETTGDSQPEMVKMCVTRPEAAVSGAR